MKHLNAISQTQAIPAKAIQIPEDLIRSVQNVDNYVGLALDIASLYIEAVTNGTKAKTEA